MTLSSSDHQPHPQDNQPIRELTHTEQTWVRALSKLMSRMPPTLLLLECADSLLVIDRAAAREIDLEDGKAHAAGVVLADILTASMKITSVSG